MRLRDRGPLDPFEQLDRGFRQVNRGFRGLAVLAGCLNLALFAGFVAIIVAAIWVVVTYVL